MGVVLEVRVFPLIAAVTPMTVGLNIPAVGLSLAGQLPNRRKIRSATAADGFVRLPPNDRDVGNAPRAG